MRDFVGCEFSLEVIFNIHHKHKEKEQEYYVRNDLNQLGKYQIPKFFLNQSNFVKVNMSQPVDVSVST